jgi:hypothetical protein
MNGQPMTAGQPKQTCGVAIASLVLGLVAFVLLGPLASIPAVICGHIALSKIGKSSGTLTGQGMAIAGLVLGYINIAFCVLVIPLLLAIAVPNFIRARNMVMTRKCKGDMEQIELAAEEIRSQANTYPPSLEDIVSKYERVIVTDPWGNEYVYSAGASGFELKSLGPDGVESEDDITPE